MTAGTERRGSRERRGSDRRRLDRRARGQRRTMPDRRRETPATYSGGEALRIFRMIRTPGIRAACPRCDSSLAISPSLVAGGFVLRIIRCVTCCRVVVARDG